MNDEYDQSNMAVGATLGDIIMVQERITEVIKRLKKIEAKLELAELRASKPQPTKL